MKKVILVTIIFFAFSTANFAQSTFHVIKVKKAKDTHGFFHYTGKDIPIISGHRGGNVKGFPENSIESFENTLKHTPAFFEIDPRLTKDGVIVLMHDATIDRTTNGTGILADYTFEELQQFRLKDLEGNVTDYRIPTLEAAIEWARGKTILNLDIKDVPPERYVEIIKRMKAEAFVILIVHKPEQAMYYYREIPSATFMAHVLTKEAFGDWDKAGFPWKQSVAYIGTMVKPVNQELYGLIRSRGATCMIAAAPTYDKLKDKPEREKAYMEVFNDGADILESDFPIEVSDAVKSLMPAKSKKKKYFGTIVVKK